MIVVRYDTIGDGLSKPEHTLIRIMNGRYFASYSISGKADAIVKQMREDGRTGVLYSRGLLIQNFNGKNEDEILEIVKKDIDNGLLVAEKKHGKKFVVENLTIEKK